MRKVLNCLARNRRGNSLSDILMAGSIPDAKMPRILMTWRNGTYACNMDVKLFPEYSATSE